MVTTGARSGRAAVLGRRDVFEMEERVEVEVDRRRALKDDRCERSTGGWRRRRKWSRERREGAVADADADADADGSSRSVWQAAHTQKERCGEQHRGRKGGQIEVWPRVWRGAAGWSGDSWRMGEGGGGGS